MPLPPHAPDFHPYATNAPEAWPSPLPSAAYPQPSDGAEPRETSTSTPVSDAPARTPMPSSSAPLRPPGASPPPYANGSASPAPHAKHCRGIITTSLNAAEPYYVNIRITKTDVKFSAAHFTIFSRACRERLHGHDFLVSCSMTARIIDNIGHVGDYALLKKKLRQLVKRLDERVLMPGISSSTGVETVQDGDRARIFVNGKETYVMPWEEVLVLPDVTNVTAEELSRMLLRQLITEEIEPGKGENGLEGRTILDVFDAARIELTVECGPGQASTSLWISDQ